MTRRIALKRLYQHLLARRNCVSKKLAGDIASIHDFRAAEASGDSADLAFEAAGDEMSLRLAEFDDLELGQIERALVRWRRGIFGICDSCKRQIPLPRLNALAHTPFCINCEREMEGLPSAPSNPAQDNWAQVVDAQSPMNDQRFRLAELEMKISRAW